MALYRYRAYGSRGDLAEGEIEAASPQQAADSLWAKGLAPFETLRADGAPARRWRQRELFRPRAISQPDLAAFTREFATLGQAEVPIDDALRILAQQQAGATPRRIAAGLLEDVLGGAPLSEAMRRRPPHFSPEYLSPSYSPGGAPRLADVA